MKRGWIQSFIVAAIVVRAALGVRADPLQSVARHLAEGLDRRHPQRLAVLPFPYHNGDVSSGSSIVSERLITFMFRQHKADIVERALMDKAMGEIRLGMTGAIDPATTQKLGKMLGASAIVSGTLIDLEDDVTEVNARLIQTETGSILAAATTRIPRTWLDLPSRPRREDNSEDSSSSPMSKMIPTSPAPPPPVSDVLTLTRADLVPLHYGGETDPEGIVDHLLSEKTPPRAEAVHVARRIYHRNPDPRLRGRALMAMGHLFERSLRPDKAAEVYNQVLREFPDTPALQSEARQGLDRVSPAK